MLKGRFQTKFLLSLLLVTIGLTCAVLIVVEQVLRKQVQDEIWDDLRHSEATFQNVQSQHEKGLSQSAELLANLPILKALMTTHDAATVQDASFDLWKLAGSGIFTLADPSGSVVALHTTTPGFSVELTQKMLQDSLALDRPRQWWYGAGHLYEVFLQPIYFGPRSNNSLLGVLAVGYEIDDKAAHELSRIAGAQVAFQYGNSIVVSTLLPGQQSELAAHFATYPADAAPDVRLRGERFLLTSTELSAGEHAPVVRLSILKSYDHATAFLRHLNRMLLALGLAAVIVGTILILILSRTFTRPLKSLVQGVRSLEQGDYAYPLEPRGDDEVAEVTCAFDRMRQNLRKAQQQLLASERMATIGAMAGSISHDLRHSLTAVVANAEFLCAMDLTNGQREDLYLQIRGGVDQMTELIESLLEFSRTTTSLNLAHNNLKQIVDRAIHAVRRHPQWQPIDIGVVCDTRTDGWFDEKRLQRVFYNLLLNACEAAPASCGRVEVHIRRGTRNFEIRIRDNGSGIPDAIRDRVFQPFVSYAKQNGSGMGLALVQKIVQDHGGSIQVESTSPEGTVFAITLPTAPHGNESETTAIAGVHQ